VADWSHQTCGRLRPEARSSAGRSQTYAMQRFYLCDGLDLRGANTGQFSGIGIADMRAQLGIRAGYRTLRAGNSAHLPKYEGNPQSDLIYWVDVADAFWRCDI
jgi:hypothetical protein